MHPQTLMTPAQRAAATRRIRRRAADWRQYRVQPGERVEGFTSQLRMLRDGTAPFARGPLCAAALRANVEETMADKVRGVRYALRRRLAEPGCASYWREQAVKGLRLLRQRPDAETALAIVLSEMEAA